MKPSPKSQHDPRSTALYYCGDFVAAWDRFSSIVAMMENSLLSEVKEAGDGEMDTYAPEMFALDLYWLRSQLEEAAKAARDQLEAVGTPTGPRS